MQLFVWSRLGLSAWVTFPRNMLVYDVAAWLGCYLGPNPTTTCVLQSPLGFLPGRMTLAQAGADQIGAIELTWPSQISV